MYQLILLLLLVFVQTTIPQQPEPSTMTTIVHTPTNNLEESLSFYKKLNYKVLSDSNPTLVTDGKVVIEINPDRFTRPGVKIFRDDWKEQVSQLKELTVVHDIDNGYLLTDLNGCWIYLIEGESNIDYKLEATPFGTTGNFYGVNIEASDMQKSFDIWSVLGFTNIMMGAVDKGFVAISNDSGFPLALMKARTCPHLFFTPSMTFFNGKENLNIIQKIRAAGIPITEEITHFNKEGIVDNIIIRDPGGYGFFVFSD